MSKYLKIHKPFHKLLRAKKSIASDFTKHVFDGLFEKTSFHSMEAVDVLNFSNFPQHCAKPTNYNNTRVLILASSK